MTASATLGAPAAPPPPPRRRRVLPIILSLLVVVVGLVIAFLPATTKKANGEIFAETADEASPNGFTPSIANPMPAPASNLPPPPVPLTSKATPKVAGTVPGLYGGVQDAASCNADALVTYLDQSPDRRSAFASALDIGAGDVRPYVTGLISVVLRVDTRITEFGFAANRAVPRQAVLQSGTSVLVDKAGVPRVRCSSGNPLAEPRAVSGSPRYRGPQWSGFRPGGGVVVARTPPATAIIIIDLRNGIIIVRAGPGAGDITLVDFPRVLRQGQRATVTGRDWPPGTAITITFDTPPVTLGTTNAGGDGSFATTVTIPRDAPPGLHTITMSGGGAQSPMQVYVVGRAA